MWRARARAWDRITNDSERIRYCIDQQFCYCYMSEHRLPDVCQCSKCTHCHYLQSQFQPRLTIIFVLIWSLADFMLSRGLLYRRLLTRSDGTVSFDLFQIPMNMTVCWSAAVLNNWKIRSWTTHTSAEHIDTGWTWTCIYTYIYSEIAPTHFSSSKNTFRDIFSIERTGDGNVGCCIYVFAFLIVLHSSI